MPHADLFGSAKGAVLYWLFEFAAGWTRGSSRVPSMEQYLEFRHRMIDAFVASRRPDAVVEVGAGLSQRALAWAVDRDVSCLEVDLPAMVERKRKALENLPPDDRRRARANLEIVALDVLSPHFGPMLADWLARFSRPVVVAEGLVSYFDLAERERMFAAVASALARNRGGAFVCDLHVEGSVRSLDLAARVLKAGIHVVTRGQGARPPFRDWDHVETCFRAAGFEGVEDVLAKDYVAVQPRLAEVFSPASIVAGFVSPLTRSRGHPA